VYVLKYLYKRCVLRRRKGLHRHLNGLIGSSLTMFYFLFLYLTRTSFEVFNCTTTTPFDGNANGYMSAVFVPCYEPGGIQQTLMPWATAALLVYTAGYPLLIGSILYTARNVCREDQLLRAEGIGDDRNTNPHCYEFRRRYQRLYYNFKPQYYFWILIVIARCAMHSEFLWFCVHAWCASKTGLHLVCVFVCVCVCVFALFPCACVLRDCAV
jgi:hypothetical protein